MNKKKVGIVAILLTAMIVSFLNLPYCMSVMAAENSIGDEEWEALREAAKNRQRRVIRDNDGMDCTDLPVSRGISIKSFYDYRTSYLTNYPVDTICYTPKSACFGYLTTRTDVGDRYLDNYPAEPGASTVNITPWLHEQGTDALQLQIEFARKNDIEIFAGIRVNDTHDYSDTPDAPHSCYSPFKREHPELVIGNDLEYPPYEIPYGRWSAFDFTQEAMRQYFYDVTTEIIEDYDVDGLFFDFYRHGVFFKSVAFGEPIAQSELDAMTELFTDIRAFAEACGRERGRPILISMRVPDSLEYCKAIGIDLKNWIEDDLVDIIIGGGYFHLNPWDYMVDICHENGIKYYASIERPLDTSYYGDILPESIKRQAPEDYFAREAAALQAGVDGNFYFNLFTEAMVCDNIRPDFESIKLEDKRYFITDIVRESPSYFLKNGSSYCENLPRLWAQSPALVMPGEESTYILEFGDDMAALKAEGYKTELIATLYGNVGQPDKLTIASNGQQWNYIVSNGDFHYYRIPDTALIAGANEVLLSMPETRKTEIHMETIMTGDKPMMTGKEGFPWRRLFVTHNKPESERIVDGSYFCIDSGVGRIGHVYPLAMPQSGSFGDKFDYTVSFDCKVVEASDEKSVVLRVADGRYIETVSLQTDKITLLSSGKSVNFDTTDTMHHYELSLKGKRAKLSVDGKQLINGKLMWPVGTNEAKLVGTGGFGFEGMDERSVLFGSLSVEGTSQAYWRNIAIPRIEGSEQICDFSVQMNFCGDFQKRKVESWQYQTNNTNMLATGNNVFSASNLLVGEVDFLASSGEAEVIISNGTSMVTQVISNGITQFKDVGDRSGRCVNWPGIETTHTRRYEFGDTGGRYFCGDELPVAFTATGAVTSFLSSENAARLNETERQVVRNGGIVVRPLAAQPSVVGIRASVVEQNVVPDANLRTEINAILGHANDTWITEDDMAGLTGTLALDNKNINDIEGLQYAMGVTSINLYNNNVRDLAPLTNLTNLKELNLGNNDSIADLTPLQNLYLDHLSINAGQIVDLSPLKDMDALGSDSSKTYVTGQTGYIMPQKTIFPNPLKDRNGDIIPVVETDNIKNAEGGNLEIVGDYSGNLETSWDVTTTWMTDDGNHSIQFQGILIVDTRMAPNIVPDINMREAINQILARPAYTWVTETDMESFTGTLDISGRNIKSIEGMQYATGVTYINIYNNQISDITPLQGLTGLTRLIVSSNQISDLAPLANLTNLTFLNLYINNVSDLTPLANLTNLTELRLGYNSNISDLSPLKNILGLNYISINSGKIMDLSPLKDMDELVANTSKTYVTGQMGYIKPESCFFPNPLKDRNGNTVPVIETDYIKNAGEGYLEIVGDFPGSVTTSWDVTNTWQTGDVNHSIRFAGTLTIDTGSIILETQASAPTAAPEEGTYYETKHIELSTITRGASIYYTTDGSDPTTESTEYTEPIIVGADTTIKAIAVKEGLDNSPISTFEYSIPNVVTDANLRGAINEILIRSADSWVSLGDVSGLSGSLSIASKSIESVEGLQYLTDKINVISAHTNNISDLSPFTGMKNDNLYRILFSMNNISDLTPLATLTKLTFLNLYQNNISDLTPLSNMTIMGELRLGYNSNISDLTPLQNMLVLQKLSLNTGKVTDLSPLANISRLGPAANGTDAYVTGQSGYIRPSSRIFANPLKDRNGNIVPVIETEYIKNAEGGNIEIAAGCPNILEAGWDVINTWTTDGVNYAIRFAGILTIDTSDLIEN